MKSAIYLIKSAGRVKIGYSNNPWKRYRQLSTGCPTPMALIFTLYCDDAPSVERKLHEIFEERRERGEWFRVSVDEILIVIGQQGLSRISVPEMTEEPLEEGDRLATDEELRGFFSDMGDALNDDE
jgi:hypothetical protein